MQDEYSLEAPELLKQWHRLQTGDIDVQWSWCELNERGEIIWTPSLTAERVATGRSIVTQLKNQLGGRAVQSVPVLTPDFGIRFPDVSWMPTEKWSGLLVGEPLPAVPDVCVFEVLGSSSPIDAGMRTRAYLAGGAREVVVITTSREVQYWGAEGQLPASALGLTLTLDE
jgi:hypothetical protein